MLQISTALCPVFKCNIVTFISEYYGQDMVFHIVQLRLTPPSRKGGNFTLIHDNYKWSRMAISHCYVTSSGQE